MDPVICGYCNKTCNATCSDWEDGRKELDPVTDEIYFVHQKQPHKSYEYNRKQQNSDGSISIVRVRT